MSEHDTSDSTMEDSDDAVFDEADSLYRSILNDPSKNGLWKQKFHDLQDLLAERIILKLELTYEQLTFQSSCAYNETFAIFEEQQSLMQRILSREFDISANLSVHHSYLDHIGCLSESATNNINQWSKIRPAILHDKRLEVHMTLVLSEYRQKTQRFLSQVWSIHDQLTTIINSGLFVLCRLSPSKVSVDFLRLFTDGLNSFNSFVHCLTTFSDNTHQKHKLLFGRHLPEKIDLKRLLKMMSRHQGLFMAEIVCDTLEHHLEHVNNLPEQLQASTSTKEEELVRRQKDEFPRSRKKPPRPDPTSDYYSSSASSTRTDDRLPPIKPQPKLNFRLHHQMQDLYTSFLEQRYAVFISLLDSAGKYRSLFESTRVHKHKTVIWLDDVVQKQRKKLWKSFVGDLWEDFQMRLGSLLLTGWGTMPSLCMSHGAAFREVMALVKDALDAVPLPDSLVSNKEALMVLSKTFEFAEVYRGMASFAISARNDKCQAKNTPTFGTQSGIELNRVLGLGLKHRDLHRILVQIGTWWTATKGVHLLSTYQIDPYIAVRYGDTAWATSTNLQAPTVMKTFQRLDKCFRIKFSAMTKECLIDAIPSSKSFLSTERDVSDHTIYLVTTMLEPVFESSRHIPSVQRIPLFEFIVSTFLASWVEYLIGKPFKMNDLCAKRLEEDFAFVREWIRNSEYLNTEERQFLSDLSIFDYLMSGTAILMDPDSSAQVVSARYHRHVKNRVAPNPDTDPGALPKYCDKESVELSVINQKALPSLQEWKKMKKGFSLGFPCLSTC